MSYRPGCYNPDLLFKPQWAYKTPAGYRDEPYLIPFTFRLLMDGSLHSSIPLQLDDDAPYIWRAILFPAVGPLLGGGFSFPGLVRIRDSHGNPLTDGLVYSLGAYGLSGMNNQNAFGFPIEPEIECSPGGTLLFDFQMSSTGFYASFLFNAALGTLLFYATIFGTAGNALTIQLIDPGAPNVPLSVALVGGVHVQVTLATNGGSVITSTLADVAAIINGTPAIAAVMLAQVQSVPLDLATALAQTPLAGGSNGSVGNLNGTLIGVKRWRECL
jgi:hypothetical protein